MNTRKEPIHLRSLGDELAGDLVLPDSSKRWPVLIICHAAGEFKENYFELCELLASRGVATLAIDMHGHGESAGERYYVNMVQWVADVQAAIDFLLTHPNVDGNRIGAFGVSSGGTAILEAALVDPRLKALIALDATVRNSLPLAMSIPLQILVFIGKIKKLFTKKDLRVPLAKMSGGLHLASDPELDKKLQNDPRALAAYNSFPFPGAAQAFFVNTIKRVSRIAIPTLVLWGEDDQVDPPETGRLLFAALKCKKELHIIPGNGHAGHLDRNKAKVFSLTADWMLQNLA
jgi:alpha-beta hydrolase superfamily lysophospholipase